MLRIASNTKYVSFFWEELERQLGEILNFDPFFGGSPRIGHKIDIVESEFDEGL